MILSLLQAHGDDDQVVSYARGWATNQLIQQVAKSQKLVTYSGRLLKRVVSYARGWATNQLIQQVAKSQRLVTCSGRLLKRMVSYARGWATNQLIQQVAKSQKLVTYPGSRSGGVGHQSADSASGQVTEVGHLSR